MSDTSKIETELQLEQVESELFSTAGFVKKPNLSLNWSSLRLPVMRTERVNDSIGDSS